jgi:hypothetical protein
MERTKPKCMLPFWTGWNGNLWNWFKTLTNRPSEPRGPLNIGNVHKTGCTLDWKPPEDDGGAAVSHYVVEKLDLATGRWTGAGESTDCKMDVTDLTPGHEYRFRVKAVNKYGESDPLEAQKSIVAKDPFDTADRPGGKKK